MKKFLILLLSSLMLAGCSVAEDLDNTPTKKVENYLNKYQEMDEDVIGDLDDIIDFGNDNNDEYKDIIKSNYQKMTYKVKNEEIDGDNAVVTGEIDEVSQTAYKEHVLAHGKNTGYIDLEITSKSPLFIGGKGLDEIDNYYNENSDEFNDDNSFDKYRLDKFKEIKDKTTYTIDFTLTRINKKWNLDNPTSDIRNKISGMYK